jgi:hypothetical protein
MKVVNTLHYGDFEYRLPDDYPVNRFANAIFEARRPLSLMGGGWLCFR